VRVVYLKPDKAPPHQDGQRPGSVLPRPGAFLTFVILSCVAVGLTIFWLLRSARI
jgi:hypothetical protein